MRRTISVETELPCCKLIGKIQIPIGQMYNYFDCPRCSSKLRMIVEFAGIGKARICSINEKVK